MTIRNTDYLQSALKAGLSGKASSVYVTLLEAGIPLSPKAIIIRTGLHRQYVYDALEELHLGRLIIKEGEKKRIRYRAGSPDKLREEIERRRLETLSGVQNLMHLYDRSPAGIVEIIRGGEAVIADELQLLEQSERGSFLDIVGGAGMHWVHLFGDRVQEWEDLRKERGIKLRYIGSGDDVRYNREESVIDHKSRLIPNLGDVVSVAIRPDSVSFNIYEPEIMVVRVKNPEAVLSQRALFEVLWKVAQ